MFEAKALRPVWISFDEALALVGDDLFRALRAGAVEARGQHGFRSSEIAIIPRRDWEFCTFNPTLEGKPVEGVRLAFWHADWTNIEMSCAEIEALGLRPVEPADAAPPRRTKKGPVPGTTNTITQERRALFPKIDELLSAGAKSVTAAVNQLAESSDLPGTSNTKRESKISLLAKQYRSEKDRTRQN
jgi:hypothetical protein